MRLTVVGSAGSVAGPDNPASCYLVEADDGGRTWRLVLELGSGAVGPLQRYCDPARVDAVLISHGHLDHCGDLIGLSVLRRYGPARDAGLPPMPLLAPAGVAARIAEISGDGGASDLAAFDVRELAPGDVAEVGPFTIDAAAGWHILPSLAFRIEGPGEGGTPVTLAYTGDTDVCDEVRAAASGADLLLAEAGWAHREVNPAGVHMTGAQAGELALDAGVGALLVTHVASWVDPQPTLDQARRAFPAAELALPGAVVAL